MKEEFKNETGCKVRLTKDLTQYHNSLKIGIVGTTVGRKGIWSKNATRFITVKFPEHTLDVLWSGLEKVE
jgi:hypothetical protein